MPSLESYFQLIIFVCLCQSSLVLARYNGDACCNLALREKAFINTTTLSEDYICGQNYNPNIAPAPDLLINHTYCASHCPGFGLSSGKVPSQWAALIVQFLLPAIIFSMTIPRQQKIEVAKIFDLSIGVKGANITTRWLLGAAKLVIWILSSIFLVIPLVILDCIVWISIIVVAAGPMMIGGLYEALLDYRIIIHVRDREPPQIPLSHAQKVQLLISIVSGNLIREVGNPQPDLFKNLSTAQDFPTRNEEMQTRLLSMMSSQSSFGSAVGAPVIFYLGAFVYTILDLENQKSNQDAAISLAFGVEWMIIVHVAIVSGCLLASNNPSTSSAIVGRSPDESQASIYRKKTIDHQTSEASDQIGSRTRRISKWLGFRKEINEIRHLPGFSQAYETRYQPVWLWSRGSNKMDWIRHTEAWKKHEWFRNSIRVSALHWSLFIFLPVIVLIVLPPATGGIVAYVTPPLGWGCRSLSFTCYAAFQVILTFITTLNAATKNDDFWVSHPKTRKFCRRTALVVIFVASVGSLFTAIGGTMMQIMGVFRNCLCYVNARYWLHPDSYIGISVASDTQDQRISSRYWVVMSSVATGFMALVGYIGWWYQRQIRQEFIVEVKALDSQRDNVPSVHNSNGERSVGTSTSLNRGPKQSLTRTNTSAFSLLTVHESTFGSPIQMDILDNNKRPF